MDTLLTALGLLLIATTLTLMVFTPRSWLVALAHGFGVQGVVGACASAIQIVFLTEKFASKPLWEKIHVAVQGIPFHATGWTGRMAYDAALIGPAGPPAMHLDQFLPIAAIQMTFIAVIISFRKMRQSDSVDLFFGLIVLAIIANAAMNVKAPWWGI